MRATLYAHQLLKYSAIYLFLCVFAGSYIAICFALGYYSFSD